MFYNFPKTPLYAPLLGLIAGILIGYLPLTVPVGGAAVCLLALSLILGQNHLSFKKTARLLMLFFCAGAAITIYKNRPLEFPPSFNWYTYTVINMEKAQSDDWPYKITLQTVPKKWWEPSYVFLLYCRYKPFFKVGDVIKIPELQIKPPGDPYFSLYFKKEGIDATAFLFCLKAYTRETPRFSFVRWVHKMKQYCITSTKNVLSPETYALFLSVFLGNKDEQKQSLEHIRPLFLNWGLAHQLARAGLHLLFLIPLLVLLVSILPLPFFIKELLMISTVGIYALLSWTSIPFLRACCCFLILRTTMLFSFFMPSVHILLLTALLVLAHNPLQLFCLDFQLSFFLSLSLLWINHIHHARSMNDKKTLIYKK